VFVVAQAADGTSRAQFRQVHVEASAGDEVVIRQGLAAGERVAASGSFKLRDAALVAVIAEVEAVAANRNPSGARGVAL
jgi:membrane fusion protein, multidrug efflux system